MPEITEQQLKQAFFENVIRTQDTVRLVALAPDLEGDSQGPPAPMEIFRPTSWDDEYDLVLSLCADGTQRLTLDFDVWDASITKPHDALVRWNEMSQPMNRAIIRPQFVTPSTSNWHLWGDAQISWQSIVDMFDRLGNPGYKEMNQFKGYCALRPPWKNKYHMRFDDAMGMRFNRKPDTDMFAGIDWSKVPAEEEQKSSGTGWDDLGWDE